MANENIGSLKESAPALAAAGYRVLACNPRDKKPATVNGVKDATVDLREIDRAWTLNPQFNIGLATGDTCWVLDLDGPEGIEAFERIRDGRPIPDCPISLTGGDGKHLFFAADPRAKNRARIGGMRIDVRAAGGYVVAPPSIHPNGTPYSWERHILDVEPPPASDWLIEFVTSRNETAPANESRRVMMGDIDTHPGVDEGSRNSTLCKLVGARLYAHDADPTLMDRALAFGKRCNPPMDDDEVCRIVQSLSEKHIRGKDVDVGVRCLLKPYSDITPQEVEWIWRIRIPRGKLSMLIGDPSVQKTFVALDIVSHVSTGRPFPDGAPCKQGEVIFVTFEDGEADTIRPRLDSLGADPSRVHHLRLVDQRGDDGVIRLDVHLPLLKKVLKANPRICLIVFDPLSACLGKIDSHSNTEVRAVLAPLARLAEETNVGVIGINHLTKQQNKSIYRSLGSMGFVAASRAVWQVAQDPDDPDRRLFLPVKNNLAKVYGLAFKVIDGKVVWESGEIKCTPDDLGTTVRRDTPRDEAKEWLLAHLAGGQPKEAKEVIAQAKKDGIKEKTLQRAKQELRVISEQHGGRWTWRLPAADGDDTYTF